MTQEKKIKERQEQVSRLLMNGYSELEIANKIGSSLSTIARDVKFLKSQSHLWLNQLPKSGLIFEFQLSLNKLKDLRPELEFIIRHGFTTDNKLKAIKIMQDNISLYSQLLSDGPASLIPKRTKPS